MHRSFVAEFTARRPSIRQAWERRLRLEPVTSALANPDTLVLLMDRTLDELGRALAARCANAGPCPPTRPTRPGCLCGLNPLLAYFRVAASVIPAAMSESANHCPSLDARAYAGCLQETLATIQTIAHEEVRAFCAMCQTAIARSVRLPPGTDAAPFANASADQPQPAPQRESPVTESARIRSR